MADNTIKSPEEALYEMLSGSMPDMDKIKNLIDDNGLNLSETLMKKLFPERFDKIDIEKFGNIIDNLKNFDDKFGTKEFVGLMSQSNKDGYNPVTYLVKQATVKAQAAQNEQKDEALRALSILKEKGVDFSIKDANGANLLEIVDKVKRNSPIAAEVIPEDLIAYAKEKAGLEVGGNGEALLVNESEKAPLKINEGNGPENPKEKVADVNEGYPDGYDDKGKTKHPWKRIQEKDIIDYLYNDVFLECLNSSLEWLNNKLLSPIDNWAESTKINAEKIKANAAKEKDENLKKAKIRCANMLDLSDDVREIANAKPERRTLLGNLFDDIRNNIGKDPQQWQHVSDEKTIKKLNRSFKKLGEAQFFAHLEGVEAKKEAILLKEDIVLRLAHTYAAMDYVNDCLNNSGYGFLEENVDLEKKFNNAYSTISEQFDLTLNQAAEISDRLGFSQEDKEKTIAEFAQQFVENYTKHLQNSHNALSKEVEDGQFKANNGALRQHSAEKILHSEPDILVDLEKISTLQGIKVKKEMSLTEVTKAAIEDSKLEEQYNNKNPVNGAAIATLLKSSKQRREMFQRRLTPEKLNVDPKNQGPVNTGGNNGR